MKEKPKIIVIVGQTASGKTSLSITLAKAFNGEIISADSRQVYRGLDIGSGKVTEEEMGGIPHHLLDVADPNDVYTVADYVRDARTAIADIQSRGKTPIIVGGTFFYVDALLGRISTPEVPPNPALRTELEQIETKELFRRLESSDPRRASDIDRHNRVRLIRALEIVDAIGAVPEIQQEELYDTLTIGIDIEKKQLHKNIHDRLLTRMELGMVSEVEGLRESGVSWERFDSLGLEYRYIADFLQEKISKEEMLTQLETEIRHFAKRQMTWLRRDKTIRWHTKDDINEIQQEITAFLST